MLLAGGKRDEIGCDSVGDGETRGQHEDRGVEQVWVAEGTRRERKRRKEGDAGDAG